MERPVMPVLSLLIRVDAIPDQHLVIDILVVSRRRAPFPPTVPLLSR